MDDKTAPKDAPPLTIMSISSRTVLHLSQNKRELVCVSMRTWQDCESSRSSRASPEIFC